MATTYLRRNPSGNGNQRKFTFSFWIKKNSKNPASTYSLFDCGTSSNYFHIYFPDTHTLTVKSRVSNSTAMELVSTRVFRDSSAWYNIIVAVDSTQGTAANRCKIYVNGVQETAFNTANYGIQNLDHEIQDAGTYHVIGTNYAVNADEFFDGSMSYVAMVDGTQELPGIFGETDSTTGEWQIKTSITPSVAWGYNGFLILVNGNSVTDQSTNSNNFTVAAGTLTKTEDCPSNVFAVLNGNLSGAGALSNGNTTITRSASSWQSMVSTLGLPSTGKFYCEFKIASGTNHRFGICDDIADSVVDKIQRGVASEMGEQTNSLAYLASNGNSYINASSGSYGASISSSNVLGMAIDMTNMKLYFSKDGVFQNSGVPTSGSTGTGALAIPTTTGTYFIGITNNASSTYLNFGNGYFGATAVASAGTNASGNGIFEYDTPTGYTALSTKGLNE